MQEEAAPPPPLPAAGPAERTPEGYWEVVLSDPKARAMTGILAGQADEVRAKAKSMIREADKLSCENWNERMWADGEPIDPSPTVDQAINEGYPWLQIECSRCKTPREIYLAALGAMAMTLVHDLASRLRCAKCKRTGKRPVAMLLLLAPSRM